MMQEIPIFLFLYCKKNISPMIWYVTDDDVWLRVLSLRMSVRGITVIAAGVTLTVQWLYGEENCFSAF